jgi:hypothetical protein
MTMKKLDISNLRNIHVKVRIIPHKFDSFQEKCLTFGSKPLEIVIRIRGEIAWYQSNHKYLNNAWSERANSPPTLLFIPFHVPLH